MTEQNIEQKPQAKPEPAGVNVLLYGSSGAGKTYAAQTMVAAGIETFVMFTEPGMGTFNKFPKEILDKLHYQYVPTKSEGIADLIKTGQFITKSSYKTISGFKDPNKQKHDQFVRVLQGLYNFTDQNGKEHGPVDQWGNDKAIIIDGLSGLNQAALEMMTGSRPAADQSDYGVAMRYLESAITTLVMNTKAHFVLIAHAERERDEILGRTTVMPGALGNKLSPKLGRYFDEVILAKKNGDKFVWSTSDTSADTKARFLPLSDNLAPDYGAIIKAWRE